MSIFDQRRTPPTPPTSTPDNIDTIADALDSMTALAAQARATADPFGSLLADAILDASRVGNDVRLAHFRVADAQQAALKDIEKGADAAVTFAARSGQTVDRNAVLKDAAQRSAATALSALGPEVLGGPVTKGTKVEVLPSLSQRAADAGRALEGAVARAGVRWRAGAGRPTGIDDQVDDERLRSILRSKPLAEVQSFAVAMLADPDLDAKTWARLDVVCRTIATDALQHQPAGDQRKVRASSGAGPARMISTQILDALDREVEKREPASIKLAIEALEHYRHAYKLMVAPNASFLDATEYSRMRSSGNRGLAQMMASWSIDPNAFGRFLAPRPWRLPGWAPLSHTDRLTGAEVRKAR